MEYPLRKGDPESLLKPFKLLEAGDEEGLAALFGIPVLTVQKWMAEIVQIAFSDIPLEKSRETIHLCIESTVSPPGCRLFDFLMTPAVRLNMMEIIEWVSSAAPDVPMNAGEASWGSVELVTLAFSRPRRKVNMAFARAVNSLHKDRARVIEFLLGKFDEASPDDIKFWVMEGRFDLVATVVERYPGKFTNVDWVEFIPLLPENVSVENIKWLTDHIPFGGDYSLLYLVMWNLGRESLLPVIRESFDLPVTDHLEFIAKAVNGWSQDKSDMYVEMLHRICNYYMNGRTAELKDLLKRLPALSCKNK